MRVCVVYDCLYPHTIGGAERWYRALSERLAAAGHDVTYLTLGQWVEGEEPNAPRGVQVVAVGPRMDLYASGRRRLAPPLRFGVGVLRHLVEHGGRYDIVHTASFPYFSLLAAGLVRRSRRLRLVVDWHEVWSREYWHRYAGTATGEVGWRIQRLCAGVPHTAFCFSRLHARRLLAEGYTGEPTVLRGEYDGPLVPRPPEPSQPVVVFAGRLIPEKRARSLVPSLALARARIPDLRLEIYGDGPERAVLLRDVAEAGMADAVHLPGFVDEEVLDRAIRRALCVVLPSEREGYGRIVIDAAVRAVPSVVVAGPDNAAVELVEDGVNGFVASSCAPSELANTIVATAGAGQAMRASTAAWFERNRPTLSIETSVSEILRAYETPEAHCS